MIFLVYNINQNASSSSITLGKMAGKHKQTCSIAGFLNLFGDAWTLLIVREALYGTTRFSDFQRNTGAAKNLLSERLSTLVEHGVLEKVNISTVGSRYEYRITGKGKSLNSLLASIILWSNEHLYENGEEPNLVLNRHSGTPVRGFQPCFKVDAELEIDDLVVTAGPGANDAARKRLACLSKKQD